MTRLKKKYRSTVNIAVFSSPTTDEKTAYVEVMIGDNGGKAVMVSAHYDSVAYGPGATDDAAGTAVMMELAHAVAAVGGLKVDVLFLWVDGEEVNCQGSSFWSEHGTFRDRPTFAINLEGSGAASKEALVRSNSDDAVGIYARYAPKPFAIALSEWLYSTLSVGYTDNDVYFRMGIHSVDLVYISNKFVYHTKDDNFGNVKIGALQHEGDNVLAILMGVAENGPTGLPHRYSPDYVENIQGIDMPFSYGGEGLNGVNSNVLYFSILGSSTFHLSKNTCRILFPVLAIVMMIIVGCVYWFRRKKQGLWDPIRISSASKHMAVAFASLLLSLVSSYAAYAAVGEWKDERVWYWGGRDCTLDAVPPTCLVILVSLLLPIKFDVGYAHQFRHPALHMITVQTASTKNRT